MANVSSLAQESGAMNSTQLLAFRISTGQASIGFTFTTSDLHNANKIAKQAIAFRRYQTYLTASLTWPKSQFGSAERLANTTSNPVACLASSEATTSSIARSVSSTKCVGRAGTIRSTVETSRPARF